MSNFSSRYTLCLLAGVTAALILLAGCWHSPDAGPHLAPQVQTSQVQTPSFVGNAACAACHPDVFNSHSHTRHAATLWPVSRQVLGKLAPPTGPILKTGLVVVEKADKLAIGLPAQSDEVAPLDYALGSGKTGMTYVSLIGGNKIAEFRMSYFPHQKQWYVTPGQEKLAPDDIGKVHPTEDARRCFLCHAVALPPDSLTPEKRFLGVGCESCHGPGGAHIAAVQAGQPAGSPMEKMKDWPATRLNEMCGKCHGTKQDVEMTHLSKTATNRLQAYGLMESKCFKQSKDKLSCVTCHDPHTNASTDTKSYEAVCLTCHSSATVANHPAQVQRVAGKTCPVNPKAKCIGCHMPDRQAIANTQLPTFMADHFIRVHR
jgi:hypothetical protein